MQPQHPETSASTLRYRPTAQSCASGAPTDDDHATSSDPASTTFVGELSEVRQILAGRVKDQQEKDGWVTEEEAGEEREESQSDSEDREVHDSLFGSRAGAEEQAVEGEQEAAGGEEKGAEAEGDQPEEPLPPDDRTCRICFEGAEDDESGRLFSPCLCKGTARYVHVQCLNHWRAASQGHTAFYQCDQCNYKYKLGRTRIAGLAQNRLALLTVTLLFLSVLITCAGYCANWVIETSEMNSLSGEGYESDMTMPDYIAEALSFFGGLDEGFQVVPTNPIRAKSTSGPVELGLKEGPPASLLQRVIIHFIKGTTFLGLVSFFQMFIATSFFGPFGFRGSSLFRLARPARRNGDNQSSWGQVMLLIFVVVGLFKAVVGLWSFVNWIAKKALGKVEGYVMDVA